MKMALSEPLQGSNWGLMFLGVKGPSPFPSLLLTTLSAAECHGGKAGEPRRPTPPGLLRRCGRGRVGEWISGPGIPSLPNSPLQHVPPPFFTSFQLPPSSWFISLGLAHPLATSGLTCCCHLLEPPGAPSHLISYPQTGKHLALAHLIPKALAPFGPWAFPCLRVLP